ncbi:MAG: hypothetical protein V1750_04890, partial [Acidobacteriota bacterium]
MPTTRFTSLCEAVVEAGWLAALLVTPLFFNVHSARIFEPEKASLLCALSLVMAAAWLAKVACGGRAFRPAGDAEGRPSPGTPGGGSSWPLGRRWLAIPLLGPVLLYLLAQLVAGAFSIAPRLSWWGSFYRMQGMLTTLSYLLIFFLVLGHLRTAGQWRRVMTAVVLAGVAVGAYGLLQRFDLDPIPWGGQFGDRVASTLGNPIFAAAFALFPTFLTLEALASASARLRAASATFRSRLSGWALVVCLALALMLELATFALAGSRGPLLALLVGLGVLGVLWWLAPAGEVEAPGEAPPQTVEVLPSAGRLGRFAAGYVVLAAPPSTVDSRQFPPHPTQQTHPPACRPKARLENVADSFTSCPSQASTVGVRVGGRRGWALVVLAAAAAIGVATFAARGSGTPAARLGTALDPGAGSTKVRLLIWDGALRLLASRPHELPDGTPDGYWALRPLIGYGPETLALAAGPYISPDLAPLTGPARMPDRAHNETLDALVTTGALGLAVLATLAAMLVIHTMRALGLPRLPRLAAAAASAT